MNACLSEEIVTMPMWLKHTHTHHLQCGTGRHLIIAAPPFNRSFLNFYVNDRNGNIDDDGRTVKCLFLFISLFLSLSLSKKKQKICWNPSEPCFFSFDRLVIRHSYIYSEFYLHLYFLISKEGVTTKWKFVDFMNVIKYGVNSRINLQIHFWVMILCHDKVFV